VDFPHNDANRYENGDFCRTRSRPVERGLSVTKIRQGRRAWEECLDIVPTIAGRTMNKACAEFPKMVKRCDSGGNVFVAFRLRHRFSAALERLITFGVGPVMTTAARFLSRNWKNPISANP
jgi:hypothetical protein